ncbi:MAG: DUF45 domain-containing protein [Alphaproteobacteria bacterium]|nr:DUF45 domain-containing protein [Alphaproteobacteria bacterium]
MTSRPPNTRRTAGPSLFKIDGVDIAVELRRNARARRYILRVDPRTRRAIVTMPVRASSNEALAFARSRRLWILGRLLETPAPTPFGDGVSFPLEGEMATIRRRDAGRGATFEESVRELSVACAPEHLNRRVVDWLKRRARERLSSMTDEFSTRIGERRGPIAVRDQQSRWGSCSSDGALSFSWRLILAPSFVLDYVAAHECAHLRHMNHSPAFWRLVDRMGVDRTGAEEWLKRRGPDLFCWGVDA